MGGPFVQGPYCTSSNHLHQTYVLSNRDVAGEQCVRQSINLNEDYFRNIRDRFVDEEKRYYERMMEEEMMSDDEKMHLHEPHHYEHHHHDHRKEHMFDEGDLKTYNMDPARMAQRESVNNVRGDEYWEYSSEMHLWDDMHTDEMMF